MTITTTVLGTTKERRPLLKRPTLHIHCFPLDPFRFSNSLFRGRDLGLDSGFVSPEAVEKPVERTLLISAWGGLVPLGPSPRPTGHPASKTVPLNRNQVKNRRGRNLTPITTVVFHQVCVLTLTWPPPVITPSSTYLTTRETVLNFL